MSIKEKLSARRRRLRLNRSRPDAAQDELELLLPEPSPVCRLQISSTIFAATNGQPEKKCVDKIEKASSVEC